MFTGRQLMQAGNLVMNPAAGAAALVGVGGTYLANREMNRRAQPEKIGSQIGASANFDAMSELTPRQKEMMKGWDENQVQQYTKAIAESAQNAVRLNQMTPEEAQARVARASFTLDPESTTNSGQLQVGAMSATDLGDPTAGLGDYNGLGLGDEYMSQLRNAAIRQENLTQDIGDTQVSREFDRTVKYRVPLEDYRLKRDFGYTQKGAQNDMRRNMASSMMGTYANTAQQLIASGL